MAKATRNRPQPKGGVEVSNRPPKAAAEPLNIPREEQVRSVTRLGFGEDKPSERTVEGLVDFFYRKTDPRWRAPSAKTTADKAYLVALIKSYEKHVVKKDKDGKDKDGKDAKS